MPVTVSFVSLLFSLFQWVPGDIAFQSMQVNSDMTTPVQTVQTMQHMPHPPSIQGEVLAMDTDQVTVPSAGIAHVQLADPVVPPGESDIDSQQPLRSEYRIGDFIPT